MASFVNVGKSAEVIARNFGSFLKARTVLARNIKVGLSSERKIRGLIATQDHPNESILVALPASSILSHATAMADLSFAEVFKDYPLMTPEKTNDVVPGSWMRLQQYVLALYIVHLILSRDPTAETTPKHWLNYIDFLPRSENPFNELSKYLEAFYSHADLCTDSMRLLCEKHKVGMGEMKEAVKWATAMVVSRGLPVEHRETVLGAMAGTPFYEYVEGLEAPNGRLKQLQAVMCPLMDVCNHADAENAAVMAADQPILNQRFLCLRSTKPIKAGEEVLMKYAVRSPLELSFFYGIGVPS